MVRVSPDSVADDPAGGSAPSPPVSEPVDAPVTDEPKDLTCERGLRESGQVEGVWNPGSPGTLHQAAGSWADRAVGESILIDSETDVTARALVLRPDASAHTRLQLSATGDHDWRVDTFERCPGGTDTAREEAAPTEEAIPLHRLWSRPVAR